MCCHNSPWPRQKNTGCACEIGNCASPTPCALKCPRSLNSACAMAVGSFWGAPLPRPYRKCAYHGPIAPKSVPAGYFLTPNIPESSQPQYFNALFTIIGDKIDDLNSELDTWHATSKDTHRVLTAMCVVQCPGSDLRMTH